MLAMRMVRPAQPLTATRLPDPAPARGELLLRVAACGVCRTDLQLVQGDLPARAQPVTPGHQIVGRVEAVGEGVEGWRVGDRAGVAWLASTDGACAACTSGRENLCRQARFTGWDRDGGYATHATVLADFALRLPDGFTDLAAAPLLCGGVIGYRSLRVSGIAPGGRLGLYGFGASATLAIQVARHWGCRVFVCTRSAAEADQERARALGAEWVGSSDARPPEPLDAAITFAPVGTVVVAALKALDRGGTLAINAIHLDEVPALDYADLWWERSIRSVANFTRRDATEFLELAARIPVRTDIEVHPLAQADVALARLARGEVRGAAVLDCG
jgi:propanol-preferring alcohol dehydrogenase